MKKIVFTFGLISGLIMSVLMGGSLLIADKIGSGHSLGGLCDPLACDGIIVCRTYRTLHHCCGNRSGQSLGLTGGNFMVCNPQATNSERTTIDTDQVR